MSLKKIDKDCTRLHRERHQPEARKHLGFLEKKKDYKKRANDYNFKNKVLTKLRKKAFDKNPDEFHFHMINSHMENGKHWEHRQDDDEYTPEQLALMLSQDASYIQMKLCMELRKIEQLRSSLHLIDVKDRPKNSRTVFVDDQKQVSEFNLAQRMNVPKEMIDQQTLPTLDEEFLKSTDLPDMSKTELAAAKRQKQKAYNELIKRLKREEQLRLVLQKMQVKQAVNKDKAIAKKVKKGNKNSAPVYQFQQVRKR